VVTGFDSGILCKCLTAKQPLGVLFAVPCSGQRLDADVLPQREGLAVESELKFEVNPELFDK
jgi:hypothetical protein